MNTQQNIRNFCILAHINHGKSTLADRFLELTKTVPKEKMRPQYLDMMDLEREKGITIKMQPVRMNYTLNAKPYTLNLIDTPGHVDFSYEVSRSLAAVEGAILLIDATKGIQAQTIANLELARRQNLVVIPVVNKIDSPRARIEETKAEISKILNLPEVDEHSFVEPKARREKKLVSATISAPHSARVNEIFEISAKYGTNVEQILEAVVKKVPSPAQISSKFVAAKTKGDHEKSLRALIFDSKYDLYKGAVAFVRVFDGEIKANEKIYLISNKIEGEAKEVGYFNPKLSPQKELKAGEIGYIATGVKEPGKVRVGDTITLANFDIQPLAGYEEPKPMVFASIYPENPDEYELLKESLNKLKLNDAAFNFEPETKESLGRGFRCGFLGTLHAEIISERLFREYNLNSVISAPSVGFKIINKNDQELFINSARDWPDLSQIKEVKEPWVQLEVMTPQSYLGRVLELLKNLTANHIKTEYFGSNTSSTTRAERGVEMVAETSFFSRLAFGSTNECSLTRLLLIYEVPLREIVMGFYDKLKGVSQGYASMNYRFLGYRPGDLVKLEILVAGKKEEAFSKIVPAKSAYQEGRGMVKKLKEVLPRQLFSIPLQAVISGRVIARETIRSRGKDVIAPLYGGDYTRKRKLLERQKKGKKELKGKGKVHIPQKVFFEIFKK